MSERAHLFRVVQDEAGNIITDNTLVTLYEPGTTTLITDTIYQDGSSDLTRTNGWTTASGYVDFYLAAAKRVDISIQVGSQAPFIVRDADVSFALNPVSVAGYNQVIQDNGVSQPQHYNLNFVGATITEDALDDATVVSVDGLTTVPLPTDAPSWVVSSGTWAFPGGGVIKQTDPTAVAATEGDLYSVGDFWGTGGVFKVTVTFVSAGADPGVVPYFQIVLFTDASTAASSPFSGGLEADDSIGTATTLTLRAASETSTPTVPFVADTPYVFCLDARGPNVVVSVNGVPLGQYAADTVGGSSTIIGSKVLLVAAGLVNFTISPDSLRLISPIT